MKIIIKAIYPIVLVALVLTSCSNQISPPRTSPTIAIETAISIVNTDFAKTKIAIPSATLPSFMHVYACSRGSYTHCLQKLFRLSIKMWPAISVVARQLTIHT